MPRINQLQMQIPTAFSPNFTIKGWVHAKHLTQHYSRECQLPSANLLLVIDKYLEPQLFLMETIWPIPEKRRSMEGEQHILFCPPFSSLKNLFRPGSRCRDGCWGEESRARWKQPDKPHCSLCKGNGRTSIIGHTGGTACPPSLPTAALLGGKPVCQDVPWVIRDLQGWAHPASLFLAFYSNEGALVGKGAVQATGKHQGTLEGMSKCRSNPACIKCLSRLLRGWWGAGETGRQQSYCRATTNTSTSPGKAGSPWACAMLQLQGAGEPSQGGCPTTKTQRLIFNSHPDYGSHSAWDQSRQLPGARHATGPSKFPPHILEEQWPVCPSEAPPATRGRSRPPNTLPLVRFGREAAEQQVFPATGCHPRPAGPTGDVLLHLSSPGCPRDLPPLGDKHAPAALAVTRQAGGPAPKGHQQLHAHPRCAHPAGKDFPSALPSPS